MNLDGDTVKLQDDDGNTLVDQFTIKMTTTTDETIFATIGFTFCREQQDPAGLVFNYKSFYSGNVAVVDHSDAQATLKLPLINDRLPDSRLTLQYDFQYTASTRLHCDPNLKMLIDYLTTGKPLKVYFCGYATHLNQVLQKLEAGRKSDPLDRIHKHYVDDQLVVIKGIPPYRGFYQPFTSFHCHHHYLVVQQGACEIEQVLVEARAKRFNEREHRMTVVQMPGYGNRKYHVLFPPSSTRDLRIQPGEKLLVLLPGRRHWETAWSITATAPLPHTPDGYLCGLMDRSWIHREGQDPESCYDGYKINTIPFNRPDMERTICNDEGIAVKLRVDVHDGLLHRRKQCMSYIKFEVNDDDMTNEIRKMLLTNGLYELKAFDIFRNIRNEFGGKPEEYITGLNWEQQSAVVLGGRAPAGVVLVQGPPGTGKTHFIMAVIAPWILSCRPRKVLLTTQTNIGTDNLALLAQDKITNLAALHPARSWIKRRYTVRVHVNDTEMKIYTQKVKNKKANMRPADYRQPTQAQTDMLKTMTLASGIVAYLQQDKIESEVRGKRIQEVGLSLATRMMEMAGILSTGPKPVNRDQFDGFRASYQKWGKREKMTEEEEKDFWESAKDLRDFVLQNATIICTTVTNAASRLVYTNLAGKVDLVIADEMPRCLEADSLMLFMGRFNPSGFIVVGDTDQLGPFVETSSDRENLLSSQLQMSVQERLQKAGLEYVFLKVQHRMEPNLAVDTSDLIYKSRLEDHETTKNRELTIKIKEFNEGKFGLDTNKLLLDIPAIDDVVASKTRQATNMSRYNDYHVMYSINLAEEILTKIPSATIAILTGYQAQFHLLRGAKQNMVNQKAPAHQNIFIYKIDTVQGLEFDFVVLDNLFLSRGSAGFLRDPRRINVATSRARHGMYVLTDMRAYEASLKSTNRIDKDNSWVRAYMRRWMRTMKTVEVKELKCKYYRPGSINAQTGKAV